MIGTILDLISISSGGYRDNTGAPLRTNYASTEIRSNINESRIQQYSVNKKEEDTTKQLEKLAELKEKGYLTEEEFNTKKQELLNRI